MQFRRCPQVVEDQARLHSGDSSRGIQFHDAVEVARYVDHHGRVRRLTGEARAAAAERHRGIVLAADAENLDQVVGVERPDDADRQLAVVRGVGGVQGAVAGAELHLAAHAGAQFGLERAAARQPGV